MTQIYTTCPNCSHTRKKKYDKCLSTNVETGFFKCHHVHCGYSGRNRDNNSREGGNMKIKNNINTQGHSAKEKPHTANLKLPDTALPDKVIKYFEGRGIPHEILERSQITYNGKEILFPYFRDGELVNIKYRTGEKRFRQEKGAEKIFYGLDDINGSDTVILVEGEIDKLAFEVAGFQNVLSVPDGAPAINTKSYESKFSYIENCEKELEGIQKIILAVDSDAPGRKLEEELSRRLGPERCYRIVWPNGCKDANETLVKHGEFKIIDLIESAKPVPVEGIFSIEDISSDIDQLYQDGLPGGVSTGWPSVSQFYTIMLGEVTVITGIPSHGKSAWQTALMVNIAVSQGWRFGVFSPENQPLQRHAAQIASLYSDKPFKKGPQERMTHEELKKAKEWMQEYFIFILPPDDQLTISVILSKARMAVTRFGIKGLVIDPWNELDHSRPVGLSETEYVSDCLTKIRRFARMYQVHVWIIAHPTKLMKDNNGRYPVPTPYDIAGSAHFRNKADNCITVWRDLLDESKEVEIHIQKVRFREVGRIGKVELKYDNSTGRYSDIEV